ncbi:Gp138 family membrane-puncturing spike protein [Pectobacterium punjabense]|uniref:Gp138 family membrane-puncturing spike protein n=1 Tax=Pectobacterium punjabense TaxID=2108399 RepID=UPI0037FE837B
MANLRPVDDAEVLAATANSIKSQMRSAIPGVIQSFDPETVTCVVLIGVRSTNARSYDDVSKNDEALDYPLLVDVPVVFPRGGGCTLTFPVKPGDECLVIFADRCIDFWWQSGDVQSRVDGRMHDLSDAFVIAGPQSQAKTIGGISTSAAQLRTDDGAAFVEVAAAGDITATTTGSMTINAPVITLNGNVTINGNLSQGMGDSGGTATMNGPVNVTNDVTAGGKSLMTHTHGGVQPGNGNTGEPQ